VLKSDFYSAPTNSTTQAEHETLGKGVKYFINGGSIYSPKIFFILPSISAFACVVLLVYFKIFGELTY